MKNKIQCLECGEYYHYISNSHLKKCCDFTSQQYSEKYLTAEIMSKEYREKLSESHKGKTNSAESNKKRSEKLKGRIFSKETIQKMSGSHKGQVPWNKGLTNCYSDETIQKMKIGIKKSFENGCVGSFKGKKHSEESIQKMKGKKFTKERKQNISIGLKKAYKTGRKIPPNKGKKLSEKHKEKIGNGNRWKKHSDESLKTMRISRLDEIEEKYGIAHPNFNPDACEFFDWFNKEFGLNGQHALNGEEFHIKELGYFVDYYEPNLNLVIEWDESYHYDADGNLKNKDIKRQKEIEEYLDCEFIRITI